MLEGHQDSVRHILFLMNIFYFRMESGSIGNKVIKILKFKIIDNLFG